MNGNKKLAAFGIAATCVIGFINYVQYRSLAKRMEDLEVTVEMELFPDLAFPRIHTKESQEEELSRPCEAGYPDGEKYPSFKSPM